MKIAIDVRSLMEGRHSGVEEYTIQLVRAMIKFSPEHEYHLFYNSWKAVTLPDFGQNVVVHAWRWPNKVFNILQFMFKWPRWDSLVEADIFFCAKCTIDAIT